MANFMGTAGWALSSYISSRFPTEGSHLERYAAQLPSVELNSCFYREHQPKTYKRWADSVPEHFRFSLKFPKFFTHELRLRVPTSESGRISEILRGYRELGKKLRVILLQLPPKLAYHAETAGDFFDRFSEHLEKDLGGLTGVKVVLEPRHLSWSTDEALETLAKYRVSKVIADPERCPVLDPEHSLFGIRYYRWHGSPEIYKSRYPISEIEILAQAIRSDSQNESWCIFDNTTFGWAAVNALELRAELERGIFSKESISSPLRTSSPDHPSLPGQGHGA